MCASGQRVRDSIERRHYIDHVHESTPLFRWQLTGQYPQCTMVVTFNQEASLGSPLDSYVTVQQIADRFKVPRKSVVRVIRQGRIKAEKKGWEWLVHTRDVPASWPPPVNHDDR